MLILCECVDIVFDLSIFGIFITILFSKYLSCLHTQRFWPLRRVIFYSIEKLVILIFFNFKIDFDQFNPIFQPAINCTSIGHMLKLSSRLGRDFLLVYANSIQDDFFLTSQLHSEGNFQIPSKISSLCNQQWAKIDFSAQITNQKSINCHKNLASIRIYVLTFCLILFNSSTL